MSLASGTAAQDRRTIIMDGVFDRSDKNSTIGFNKFHRIFGDIVVFVVACSILLGLGHGGDGDRVCAAGGDLKTNKKAFRARNCLVNAKTCKYVHTTRNHYQTNSFLSRLPGVWTEHPQVENMYSK